MCVFVGGCCRSGQPALARPRLWYSRLCQLTLQNDSGATVQKLDCAADSTERTGASPGALERSKTASRCGSFLIFDDFCFFPTTTSEIRSAASRGPENVKHESGIALGIPHRVAGSNQKADECGHLEQLLSHDMCVRRCAAVRAWPCTSTLDSQESRCRKTAYHRRRSRPDLRRFG